MDGRLVQWNDARGFGFVEGSDRQRYFVHISAIERIAIRPQVGDALRFQPTRAPDGRSQAGNVTIVGANPLNPSASLRGSAEHQGRGLDWRLPLALLLVIAIAFGAVSSGIPDSLVLAYGVIGLISLLAYRSDKIYARQGHWRTSETTLLGFDLCFGIVGGLLGQALFRHKTRKPGYQATTLVIAIIHLGLIVSMATGLIDGQALVAGVARWLPFGG